MRDDSFAQERPMGPFRHAVESHDIEAVIASLADDVVFRSPVVFREYTSREVVGVILRAVVETLEGFHYVGEMTGGGQTALVFKAKVGGRDLEGVDLIERNANGKVSRLTVFVRPLSAANALKEAMAARLAGIPVP